MLDREFIQKIRQFKQEHGYTLYDLSRKIDVQISTLERWFRTGRINRIYAKVVREKLGLSE
jgi:transcriptional regulator with XRE-family HTH domain